jgi:hypothetical protein
MDKNYFNEHPELKTLQEIADELRCLIKDGTKINRAFLLIRKFTSAALVIDVNIKPEMGNNGEKITFSSKITAYKYVELTVFIYLLINELRLKTNSYKTLSALSEKYYKLGEIEKNRNDLKIIN